MSLEDIVNVTKAAKDAGVPVDKLAYNALEKPTTELGEGLGNLFWLVFSPIHAARASLEPRIKQFRQNLENKLSTIPPENLVESPLNIAGPALEAAKYYIEHESIREMFAKLIASSMDNRIQNRAHPSFIEIIKQLSPFDAENLQFLFDNQGKFGIINIDVDTKHPATKRRGSTTVAFNTLPFPKLDATNQSSYLASIENLERLKIIEITYERYYLEDLKYKIFETHQFCQAVRDMIGSAVMSDGSEIISIQDKKGIWEFTSFGKNFTRCCLGLRSDSPL
ncbi:DUF4393 domain-containing protein [Paenibacillus woosongensis]|uniref:DUF4393 domain-containing protein n=1 Tax=Paenibacillus woosongensis TaxID=307580 RepID=A0A7X3CN95_9BACL|nr:DUF4393 domain-containing protein [Paenibacillus woosongensis]MUG44937.1 DUF4393 domain-containing protein [Paenibacillus woosongensis]